MPHETGVAIIAMAGRFPGAPDLERFWANLREGVESISPLSDEELLAAGVRPRELESTLPQPGQRASVQRRHPGRRSRINRQFSPDFLDRL